MKRIIIISSCILLAVALSQCCSKASCGSDKLHPEWSKSANIYEMNIRQYTAQGTIAAAAEHLPRLKELGVDIVWVMPVQPIGVEARKGELGSYYSISDYMAVNPEFGTMDDFKAFVATAHKLGMRVILDWVANHTSRDAAWIANDDWYVKDSTGVISAPFDWTDVAELNYDNAQMRKAMQQAMLFWIKEADIDGFRCDVASEVPTEFWNETAPMLQVAKSDIFMLAEAELPELHDKAFDMSYAWELHSIMNKMAKQEYNADSLRAYIVRERIKHPRSAMRMIFTSNHDENSWNGTEFERMGAATRAFATLCYTLEGMPLIYSGQEVGLDRRLEFFVKDSIDWTDRADFTDFYRTMSRLKRENPALWNGLSGGELVEITNNAQSQVFSFSRTVGDNTVVAIYNFSDKPVDVVLDASGSYKDYFAQTDVILDGSTPIAMEGWGYKILVK